LFEKGDKRERGDGKVMEGVNLFQDTDCMFGTITVKSPHITTVCYFKIYSKK
jgi:hypothetical protein